MAVGDCVELLFGWQMQKWGRLPATIKFESL